MRIFSRKSKVVNTVAPSFRFTPQLSYQVANLQGIGTRNDQQDSFAFANAMDVTEIDRCGLFAVVADGMGGLNNGKDASSLAISSVLQDFKNLDLQAPIGNQLKESAIRANSIVYNALQGNGGTTLVSCVFYKGKLYWSNVGDSFCFLMRDQHIYQVNPLHNYCTQLYQEAIEDDCLDTDSADNDEKGHRLTSYLGAQEVSIVSYNHRPFTLRPNDTILICSDGVGGVLSQQALKTFLMESPDIAAKLIETNIIQQRRTHQDNFTALIIKCVY